MAEMASAEPRLGPLKEPKSELPPGRNASFCLGCVFSCTLVLAAVGLLLGLLLGRFWAPKWGSDRTRSRPRSASKMVPKNEPKNAPKWDPKTEVKILNFWPKRATGVLHTLGRLSLEAPCLPLGFSLAQRWPKRSILNPTCAQFVP
jgi:hypothetical protein